MALHRSVVVVAALGLVAAVCWYVQAQPRAAGEQPAKPVTKWEYATLYHGNQPIWTTPAEELYAQTWQELAERMKVTIPKAKDAGSGTVRATILNHLGSQGWELVSHSATVAGLPGGAMSKTDTWVFKRPVP